ncbi:MAG TPA: ABC transporter substrate-binding protein [Methanothrix sp.]|nr:ABC transporter substrate-binding protein [Methanothrix sp.]
MKNVPALALSSILFLLLAVPSMAGDNTLSIFGNANGDEVVDEEDLALVEAMINGSEMKTELADADIDGDVDGDDLARIEEIIRGDSTEINLIDSVGRVVTAEVPVERIIPLNMRHATAVIVLGGEDEIVGVDATVRDRGLLFGDLSARAFVGDTKEPDLETILSLEPDLVITFTHLGSTDRLEESLPSETALVRFDLSRADDLKEEMMVLGYLIGDRDAARGYRDWYDRYMGTVEERVSAIPEEDRVRVFMERESPDREASVRWAYASDTGYTDLCDVAGGVNIGEELIDYQGDVEAEWVMEENPAVIIGLSYSGGYQAENDSLLRAYRDGIMTAPGFDLVDAVKEGRVHVISGDFSLGPQMTIGTVVVAKWLYPDLFADLDPQAIHQEFLRDLMQVDYDLAEHGAFVCPPME